MICDWKNSAKWVRGLNNQLQQFQFAKSHPSVGDFKSTDNDDKEYWLSKSFMERLEAIEYLRQIMFSYYPVTERLQRFFEVVKLNDL